MQFSPEMIRSRQPEILAEWSKCLQRSLNHRKDSAAVLRVLEPEALRILRALGDALEGRGSLEGDLFSSKSFDLVRGLIVQVSAARARDGFSPTETAAFIGSLKEAVAKVILGGAAVNSTVLGLQDFNDLVDRMSYASFAAFTETREDIIRRQSTAMLEMSTPVLNLWRNLVLMPLVGVIDTVRAQQIMESLLEGVVRHEAKVVILDITGVPVVDTSVARHLTLTVMAVQMLGAQVIVTGINPETAQTLVKLDVDLSKILTRGSLRMGLQEALRYLEQRIIAIG